MQSLIVSAERSAYWENALVLRTLCGHSHVRDKSIAKRVGEEMDCPFDHEMTRPELRGVNTEVS